LKKVADAGFKRASHHNGGKSQNDKSEKTIIKGVLRIHAP
jgi:hypothetical protein